MGSIRVRPALFVAAALASLGCAFVQGLLSPSALPTRLPSTATTLPDEFTPEPGPTPSAEPADLSADTLSEMEAIERQVQALRGLLPRSPVGRRLLSPAELRQNVLEDFLADYSQAEAEDDVLVYVLLGLLEPGFDLWNLYLELYSEQIAGYYDDETQQLYVVRGAGFGGTERLTYAHEYVHALQDQVYDLDEGLGYNDQACETDSERCAGLQSLIEGDASLLEEQWLRTYATQQDVEDIIKFFDSYRSPVYDSAPLFLQQDFLFPYTSGLEFVRSLHVDGDWAAVDQAYAEVPLSTEQILHPGRYPSDRPSALEVADVLAALGPGWRLIDRNVLGEWFIRLMLSTQLEAQSAASAAEGWEGDTYLSLATDGPPAPGLALVWVSAWDGVGQAQEFDSALREYADVRFGPGEVTTLTGVWEGETSVALSERRGVQVLWIMAPDRSAADTLRSAVEFPAPES
jgi:hypothetical protein